MAFARFDERLTPTPPTAAGPDKVTAPVDFGPPVTADGDRAIACKAGGLIVSTELFDVAPRVAEIVAVLVLCTAIVFTVNVAVEEPPAIVTVAGTVAFELLDERFTIMPPAGAGKDKATVPVVEDPPVTEAGESDTLETVPGAEIVNVPDAVLVSRVAEIDADMVVVTEVVETVNVAEVAPEGTKTVSGTIAFVELDDRVTRRPVAGAAAAKVTVPVEGFPPSTVPGLSDTLWIAPVT